MNKTQESNEQQRFSRGIYLLPNLFTTAGLFAGFYAVVAAMKGRFELAAMAIFIAMIADGLDGRVARLTGTQSAFGAQYDSLSDIVAFAIAPALVGYSWGLHFLGKVGWLAAFFYVAATALRLARFNTHVSGSDKHYFYGLPCPSAAGVMTSAIWLLENLQLRNSVLYIILGIMAVSLGALMVSNIRFYSFKTIDFKGKVPFLAILLVVVLFVWIALDPPVVLFVFFTTYAVSGPLIAIFSRQRRCRLKRRDKKDE